MPPWSRKKVHVKNTVFTVYSLFVIAGLVSNCSCHILLTVSYKLFHETCFICEFVRNTLGGRCKSATEGHVLTSSYLHFRRTSRICPRATSLFSFLSVKLHDVTIQQLADDAQLWVPSISLTRCNSNCVCLINIRGFLPMQKSRPHPDRILRRKGSLWLARDICTTQAIKTLGRLSPSTINSH